jgi:hypothetical protein
LNTTKIDNMKKPAIINSFSGTFRVQLHNGSGLIKLLMLLFMLNGPGIFAQIGVHTDFPDASSAMEIYSTNKGLLVPRVTLTSSLSNPSPVTSPATGLLVFNSGSNQALGFYYWNGTSWVLIGGGSTPSGDFWSLTGNSGTIVGTHFIGTIDDEDLAIYTNESERMRITAAGNIITGITAPYHANDLFTVVGKPGLDYAINAYSPYVGVYSESAWAGFQSFGGKYGLRAELDSNGGFAVYARNFDALGYGLVAAGSGQSPSYYGGRSAGISTLGNDGIIAFGKHLTTGIGIMAAGNGLTPVALPDGFGGTFIGNVGAYARSSNTLANGTGIIGVGNNQSTSYYRPDGSGGAFTGRDGVFGKSINAVGTGVIGLGNIITTPVIITTGSGGAFTGRDGILGKGIDTTGTVTGYGIIGLGSNRASYPTITGGCGGSFHGYHGVLSLGSKASNGTGVIGAGNAGVYNVYGSGSGGAFTGTYAGGVGWATNSTSGIGIIGAGNNTAPSVPAGGSGGAFTGNDGVYAKGVLPAGTGIIAIGNNSSLYTIIAAGSGGAFTGYHGIISQATNTSGTGVIGIGNNTTTYSLHSSGSGGVFTGYHGIVSSANNAAAGTGVIGAGNNVGYTALTTGGGGAFTGSSNGVYAKATAATGTGVIGIGNNVTTIPAYSGGSGGAFTGTVCGVAGYASTAANTTNGVYGSYTGGGAFNGVGVYGYSWPNNNYGIGVYGMGRKYGVFSSGAFGGTGAKYFVIDHPMDPENKILKHAAIESPEVLNMYRGNIVLNDDGEANIQLPDYFMSININFSYDLTPVGRPAPDLYIKYEIDDAGKFTISGGNPNQKISWVVYAERNDLYMRQEGIRAVEIAKEEWEKGKYLMPELYNQPPEKGIFYTPANGEIQTVYEQENSIKSEVIVLGTTENATINQAMFKMVEADHADVQQLNEIDATGVEIIQGENKK